MAKVKTKVIYRNKEAEKRARAFDKKVHAEGEARKKDPIAHAYKESSKSPKKMFKESMSHLRSLMEKKKK